MISVSVQMFFLFFFFGWSSQRQSGYDKPITHVLYYESSESDQFINPFCLTQFCNICKIQAPSFLEMECKGGMAQWMQASIVISGVRMHQIVFTPVIASAVLYSVLTDYVFLMIMDCVHIKVL